MRILWRNEHHPLGSHAEWIDEIDAKNRQPGTSAPTLATAWAGLVDVYAALNAQPAFEGFVIEEFVVEAQAKVDTHPGGRRNHDLVLRGHAPTGEHLVICIEAKAGESLGCTVSGQVTSAKKAKQENHHSNAMTRVNELIKRFAPPGPDVNDPGALRYQLFTALAGTISEAKVAGAGHAVMLVHDFLTDKQEKRQTGAAHKHDEQMCAFSNAVFGAPTPLSSDGPWCVNVGAFPDTPGVELYLAHVVTDLRTSTLRACPSD